MSEELVSSSPPRLTGEDKLRHYKPGSIRRVKLKNFLTYVDVEFKPGPRLNVVIGPNGTGKSTILCAICLGLGGQPPLLGRADDARTFIMHEKQIASIEIEIAPHVDQPTHIIQRVIDRSKGAIGRSARGKAASTYFINGKEVKVKDVEELVSETYKIAIDNLCTFLPQDRVGSFSGFDSKQLLMETEKSVSGTKHLYNEHQRLIQLEDEMKNSDVHLNTVKSTLKELQEQVKSLEQEKDRMEERQKAIENLELYKMKHAWVLYDNKRKEALEVKAQKKELSTRLKVAKKKEQPLAQQVAQLQQELSKGKKRRVALDREIGATNKEWHMCLTKAEKCQDRIDTETCDLGLIDSAQRRAEQLVVDRQRQFDDQMGIYNQYPPQEDIDKKVSEAQNELRTTKRIMTAKGKEVQQYQIDYRNQESDVDRLNRNFVRLKDDKALRNQNILMRDKNMQQVYEWVNQNRKLFRRKIWGPIVLEVDTKDNNAANFLENHVSNAVLKSYVVECREDYHLLYREVREKRNWKVNIQVVEGGRVAEPRRMYSHNMMDMLKREHGVTGYLDEVFDAPGPVMQALQNTSNVQAVLIGGEGTYQSLQGDLCGILNRKEDGSGQRPYAIFTSDPRSGKKYKYTSTISRYGRREASLRVDEITNARMLQPGVSPAEKERVERDLRAAEEALSQVQPSMDAAVEAFQELQSETQKASYQFAEAKKARREVIEHKGKVDSYRRRLNEAKKEADKDNVTEKKKHIRNVKKYVKMFVTELENASSRYDSYLLATQKLTGLRMSEGGLNDSLSISKQSLKELQRSNETLERQYQHSEAQFKQIKQQVVALKNKATQMADIMNDEDLKDKLEDLSTEIGTLEGQIEDADYNIRNIQDNPQVLILYAAQKKKLRDFSDQFENLKDFKGAKRSELIARMEPYEAALTNITQKVNAKFMNYMKELGCAGEVRVCKGEHERGEDIYNFKDWGIEIRVKFRESSDLQVLSARVHSGGERSVSTIMYLMAMQDMMVSPFRCVDEINQGLDERNERLVFKRIVANSTMNPDRSNDPASHRGQYFLITPKLLPNLEGMDTAGVTVLCIFNGAYNFKRFGDWNIGTMIDTIQSRKRRKLEEESE